MTMNARFIAGEAANAYDEASGHPTSDVMPVGPKCRQAYQVLAEGDVLMAFQNLPSGLVRCTDTDGSERDLDESGAIAWAREQGGAWGKAATEAA